MHEVSDFQVEIPVNHKKSILCVKILFAVFLPIQESWHFGCFFQNLGPVLSAFLYLDYRWSSQATVHFQCRDVLLFWIIVGRTVLEVSAEGGCSDYHLPFFLSFHID